MNLKSLFEPIDHLIDQAKEYILEQDARKKAIRSIEEKIETIRPELEKRKEELVQLVNQIDGDDALQNQLNRSLQQVDNYLKNIKFIAEKDYASEIFKVEETKDQQSLKDQKERYVNAEVLRLEEALEATDSFFEVADYANQIWADFDLFEEFHREEIVVQMLVNRMNQTNTRNTETRMGKDLRKMLEHIRLNLIKSTAWTDDQIEEYQGDRNRKVIKRKPVNIPDDRGYQVCILGGAPEIVENIKNHYELPSRLNLEWVNIAQEESLMPLFNGGKKDLVILMSLFPQHEIFINLRGSLEKKTIPFLQSNTFSKNKVVKMIEGELISQAFKNQYSSS